MLVILSPAKKLDMSSINGTKQSEPVFGKQANELAKLARKLSAPQLKSMMKISDALADLNADRFARFGSMETKPAALAFAGDTYLGLEAGSLDTDELDWAQDHLRILSGLYGLLRPLDAIEPYRLEMGSRMKTSKGPSLYAFWGQTLSHEIDRQTQETESVALVNCASQEYFGAVDQQALKTPVITPVFKERRGKELKVISFFAKRARGAMARFIIQNRLRDPDVLKEFDAGGYRYSDSDSTVSHPVFVRDQSTD